MAKRSNGAKTQAVEGQAVRLAIDVLDGTPTHYSNYMEVTHSKWDFSLVIARQPAKPSSAKIAEMQATGLYLLPADLVINFPPSVLPGLIRALTVQKDAYEKLTKVELKEVDHEPSDPQGGRRRR